MGRIGAPFELLLVDDLGRPGTPDYKLYIMANVSFVFAQERRLITEKLRRNGATALRIYAPGYLSDQSAAVENIRALTGIRFGIEALAGAHSIGVTNVDHPATRGIEVDTLFGTDINVGQYLEPTRGEYVPDMRFGPTFFVDDPQATVLGESVQTGRAALAVKDTNGFRSIYSEAPLLPWRLVQNIARDAGAHFYTSDGDMVWANESFLTLYAQYDGEHTIAFRRPTDVMDVWHDRKIARSATEVTLRLSQCTTALLQLETRES
jgi:hypothetical protein